MSDRDKRIQQLEDELAQLREQMFQMSKLAELGRLAAETVHELSQPLLGIKAFAQLLQRRCWKDEFVGPKADIIVQQAQVMEDILGNLRQYSRRRTLTPVPVDLNSEIGKAVALFSDRAQKKRVDIQVELAADLPTVLAAPSHVQQIMVNLLTNALDALPPSEAGRIVIRGDQSNSDLCLMVADTGEGVPDDIRSLLFEPFYTTKSEDKGTGLGLSVCKDILDIYGGRIRLLTSAEVSERFDETFGAAFEVILPEAESMPVPLEGASGGA